MRVDQRIPGKCRRFAREARVHSHLRDLLVAEQVLREAAAGLGANPIDPANLDVALPAGGTRRISSQKNAGALLVPRPMRITSVPRSRWSMAAAVILMGLATVAICAPAGAGAEGHAGCFGQRSMGGLCRSHAARRRASCRRIVPSEGIRPVKTGRSDDDGRRGPGEVSGEVS